MHLKIIEMYKDFETILNVPSKEERKRLKTDEQA